MRHHGSGRGLAVGSGNADGVFIGLHDLAPCLSPLKNGNARGTGSGDLRIIIMGGGSADDAVCPLYILGTVTDIHVDAMGDQLIRRHGGTHIRAGNRHSHALQHQSQRPHGYTADTNQMHMASGL